MATTRARGDTIHDGQYSGQLRTKLTAVIFRYHVRDDRFDCQQLTEPIPGDCGTVSGSVGGSQGESSSLQLYERLALPRQPVNSLHQSILQVVQLARLDRSTPVHHTFGNTTKKAGITLSRLAIA